MIDAHQHFWQIGRNGHAWPGPELQVLYRDFLPEDLLQARHDTQITGSVVVQSQPNLEDTAWLQQMAAERADILGVVGWVPLDAAAAPDLIDALAGGIKLRGLRPMLQDLERDWILQPVIRPGLAAMIRQRLVFDALVRPCHMPAIERLAREWPTLTIVLDHAGKPQADPSLKEWYVHIESLAACPNVFCKVSGLVTEISPRTDRSTLARCVEHLRQTFGTARLIFGSDWPVVETVMSYNEWSDLALELLAPMSERERWAVFGETARRVYRL